MMEDVRSFFKETEIPFTVYVVEQRFVVGRGNEYFKSFRGENNYIDTNESILKLISNVIKWFCKNSPDILDLMEKCIYGASGYSQVNITETITALTKLFTINQHQAVGPEVIDPIIIEEGKINHKYLAQLVSLHKESILRPAIIILLQDNNFDRAQKMLSKCPHGINVKMIRNSGQSEMYKVINKGADDINSFLDAFTTQCFSTCSRTQRGILLNDEWAENSVVKYYSPSIFKIRTNLLFDEKEIVHAEILDLIDLLDSSSTTASNEEILISLKCISKIFKVYCNDYGGNDIIEALKLAKASQNDLLLAHVYRYSQFLPGCSTEDQIRLLTIAEGIFKRNNIEDHAIYCRNNRLIKQFYTESVNIRDFKNMQDEAIHNTPGLVGMSYIYNNTGVANIYTSNPDIAIEYFKKGLDYARERITQKLALMCNILIAKDYDYQEIEKSEIRRLVSYTFDNYGTTRLPFITANIIINSIILSLKHHPEIATEIIDRFPTRELITNALTPGQMGSGSLSMQLTLLSEKYPNFQLKNITVPSHVTDIRGQRKRFLNNHHCNPMIFNAWL